MKAIALLLLIIVSLTAGAADQKLTDYNWTLTDIAGRGLSKETLFSRMDRDFIKTKSSICSNRALMWANDFKRKYDLNTAKVFLFFTKEETPEDEINISFRRTWWYHVAPVINENNQLWVMDAGFKYIKSPYTIEQWTEKFAFSKNCKEIKASENELVEFIFREKVFPRNTAYGHHTCYYKIVPHTIWTPEVLAKNLLGVDASGTPVRVERSEINKDELYQACVEATASKIGRALGSSKKPCEEYVNL